MTSCQLSLAAMHLFIDKYIHNHNEKIYACFVDFKKAFDSV